MAGYKLLSCMTASMSFFVERGIGTATLELKLTQQLAYLEQEALFVTILDIKKPYDALDCERCLEILKGYGVKP